MRVLEDLGFYCVDNMPVALAESVMRLATRRDPQLAGVALGIDARERLFFPHWPRVFNELERAHFHPRCSFSTPQTRFWCGVTRRAAARIRWPRAGPR